MASLSQSIDKISEINKEISQIELSKKFPNVYKFCNGDHNKLSLLLRKVFIPMNIWTHGKDIWTHEKDLMKQSYLIKHLFTVN